MPSPNSQFERISNLPAFLAREHLEVVRWDWQPYGVPVLLVRPAQPQTSDLAACAHCGHIGALHEGHGEECLVAGCACEVYCPPLAPEGGDDE